ncbi:MAG: GNAT family N-acetyltransferase [Lachnospiraceae bacterium]|nr:GNAT family N-acetyltransferase [Lachnospiraceae bacterium]
MSNFNLRSIESSDMLTILEWSNDSETRKQSFNSSPISLEEHKAWFNRKLASVSEKQCYFYILENDSTPIGSIRLDPINEEKSSYIISYMISPKQRGLGYGTKIIKSLIDLLDEGFIIAKPVSLLAYVKPGNKASIRCFQKLGFEQKDKNISDSELVFHLSIC